MAGLIGVLPPIHLTRRANEWLKDMSVWHPGRNHKYKSELAKAMCGARYLIDLDRHPWTTQGIEFDARDWSCGVEDVRALLLGRNYVVHMDFDGPFYVGAVVRQTMTPTCEHCRVLLDHALATACDKDGQVVDILCDARAKYPDEPWWEHLDFRRRSYQTVWISSPKRDTPPLILPDPEAPHGQT